MAPMVGFRVYDLAFRVQVWSVGFRIWGFRV